MIYTGDWQNAGNTKKGKNTLVLMVMQGGGSWGFHVNIKADDNKLKVVLPDMELLNKK